tara:strand:+ start:327 stop:521 length:195 start_codon:yes stop_codon:yes gene_type:complete
MEEYEFNIDEILYLQMILGDNILSYYDEVNKGNVNDEEYNVNIEFLSKIQNKISVIKNKLNNEL